ncbi:SubName: Full=Uncharacterized protein {ECO:0000313/EMBL:CCA75949.1} [Serendipita indica DSM 11827]|nr:SubName: Full=Uncharacterized protein {ECO:0000313/EMBL:CCA75949.1} [Serendipita indica DSM 11827]
MSTIAFYIQAKCDSPGDCSSCSKSGVEYSRDTKRLLHGQPKPGYVESLLQLLNVKKGVSERRDSTKRETVVDTRRKKDTKSPNLSLKPTSESNNRILAWIRSGASLLRARVKVTQRQSSQPVGEMGTLGGQPLPPPETDRQSISTRPKRLPRRLSLKSSSSVPRPSSTADPLSSTGCMTTRPSINDHTEYQTASPIPESHSHPWDRTQSQESREPDCGGHFQSQDRLVVDDILDSTIPVSHTFTTFSVEHQRCWPLVEADLPVSSYPVDPLLSLYQQHLSGVSIPSQFLGVAPSTRPSALDHDVSDPNPDEIVPFHSQGRDLTSIVRLYRSRKVYDGPYSAVYQGVYDDGHQMEDVAIKVIKAVGPRHSVQRRRRREVMIGKILQHPNVLPVHGIVEDRMFGPFGAIVTPWCLNGNAAQYLHKHAPSPLERYRLWQGVVGGLVYLHSPSPQIVHGDMKPPNVLIAADGRPKICDLGLVRVVVDDSSSSSSGDGYSSDESREWMREINTTTPHTGTPRYLAPELVDLNDPSEPTTATDVYAAGCIGFEFIYSVVPYAHRDDNRRGQIFHDIRCGVPPARRPRIKTTTDSSSSDKLPSVDGIDALWDILELCWSRDPLRRPTASSLWEWLDTYENLIVGALQQAP